MGTGVGRSGHITVASLGWLEECPLLHFSLSKNLNWKPNQKDTTKVIIIMAQCHILKPPLINSILRPFVSLTCSLFLYLLRWTLVLKKVFLGPTNTSLAFFLLLYMSTVTLLKLLSHAFHYVAITLSALSSQIELDNNVLDWHYYYVNAPGHLFFVFPYLLILWIVHSPLFSGIVRYHQSRRSNIFSKVPSFPCVLINCNTWVSYSYHPSTQYRERHQVCCMLLSRWYCQL